MELSSNSFQKVSNFFWELVPGARRLISPVPTSAIPTASASSTSRRPLPMRAKSK